MKLYSQEMIDTYNIKKQKGLKCSLYPLFVIVPVFIFFMIIAKLKTRTLFVILATVDLSIFSIIFVYNLLENVIKSSDLINHIKSMLSNNTKEIKGTIISISKPITLKRNIHIIEIEIKADATYKLYYNIDLFDNNFNIDDTIKAKISNNFIVEYEVCV